MSKIILEIPSRVSENFGDPLNHFFSLLNKYNSAKANELILDLSSCKFINPFLIGGLSSLALHHRVHKGNVEIIPSKDNSIDTYLKLIGFPFGFDLGIISKDELSFRFSEFNNKTYIPLTSFPSQEIGNERTIREIILSSINGLLRNQLNLSGNILAGIYYLLDELSNNIAEHSNSQTGILFAQYYPTKHYLEICIADYGKGLLQSYQDSGKYNSSSHSEAIQFAISGKSTKNLPDSRGFGISTSRNMLVDGLRGKFFILSGTSFFIQTIEKQNITNIEKDYHYSGCYVALRIPILVNSQFDIYNYVE